jgi:tetratricopeptide (TPR) repeat protein
MIVTNGPFSEIGPKAMLGVGSAREKQKDYAKAVKVYEEAADRYNADDQINAEALYRAGSAYQKQARRAEYDQGTAAQAIASFTDFITLHPADARVPEATNVIVVLKSEQARGSFEIGRYYESIRRWEAARIYYNEVVAVDPQSTYAETARRKIEELNQRIGSTNRPPVQPLKVAEPPPSSRAERTERPAPAEPTRQPPPVAPTPSPSATPVPAQSTEPAREAATPSEPRPPPSGQLPEARGYRLGPTGGRIAGAQSIQVLAFANKTLEPRLTDALTAALRRNLQQDGTYALRTDREADLILSGTITDYRRTELTLSRNDALSVRDYQVFLTAQVKVVERSSGKVVFEKPFTGWTMMRLEHDLPSLERQTVPELAGELAKNITATITEGIW